MVARGLPRGCEGAPRGRSHIRDTAQVSQTLFLSYSTPILASTAKVHITFLGCM